MTSEVENYYDVCITINNVSERYGIMYKYEMRVGYSKTGPDLKMTIPAILDSFQDAATYEAQNGKNTMDFFSKNNLVWVLSAWQISIKRRPKIDETIKIITFPYDFKGFLGYRNFYISTMDDEVIVKGNSIWTLINTEKKRPQKPTEEILAGYELLEKLDMDYAPRKIELSSNGESYESFKVYKHQIDSNNHMNNVEYVKLAMEFVPVDKEVNEIRVEYKNSAYAGDIIVPVVYGETEKMQVKLTNGDELIYAVIEIK